MQPTIGDSVILVGEDGTPTPAKVMRVLDDVGTVNLWVFYDPGTHDQTPVAWNTPVPYDASGAVVHTWH